MIRMAPLIAIVGLGLLAFVTIAANADQEFTRDLVWALTGQR